MLHLPCLAPCHLVDGVVLILCMSAPLSAPDHPHRSRSSFVSPEHRVHGTPVLTTCYMWARDACDRKPMNSRAFKLPKAYTGGHMFQSRTPYTCPEIRFSHCFQAHRTVSETQTMLSQGSNSCGVPLLTKAHTDIIHPGACS